MPAPLMSGVEVVSDESLEPGDRALLLLSLSHGIADEEIADKLGTDPEEIAQRRDAAFDRMRSVGAVADRPPTSPRCSSRSCSTRRRSSRC
jgi:hypothetical protein